MALHQHKHPIDAIAPEKITGIAPTRTTDFSVRQRLGSRGRVPTLYGQETLQRSDEAASPILVSLVRDASIRGQMHVTRQLPVAGLWKGHVASE